MLAVVAVRLHPGAAVDALLMLDEVLLAARQAQHRSKPSDVAEVGRRRWHEQILLRLDLRHHWCFIDRLVRVKD